MVDNRCLVLAYAGLQLSLGTVCGVPKKLEFLILEVAIIRFPKLRGIEGVPVFLRNSSVDCRVYSKYLKYLPFN